MVCFPLTKVFLINKHHSPATKPELKPKLVRHSYKLLYHNLVFCSWSTEDTHKLIGKHWQQCLFMEVTGLCVPGSQSSKIRNRLTMLLSKEGWMTGKMIMTWSLSVHLRLCIYRQFLQLYQKTLGMTVSDSQDIKHSLFLVGGTLFCVFQAWVLSLLQLSLCLFTEYWLHGNKLSLKFPKTQAIMLAN